MFGLRKGSNNYVANGGGRDLLTFYDAGFRGGKQGMDSVCQHLPNPQVGSPQSHKLNSLGFNARNEGFQQKLNCSGSLKKSLDEKKSRMNYSVTEHNIPASLDTQPLLLRTRSDPALDGSRSFSRTVGRAASAAFLDLNATPIGRHGFEIPKVKPPPPPKEKLPESWTMAMYVPARSGFCRDPGGGMWPN
eukprot:TRINITY_DN24258_c0_g1_i1.p1 TRINITY_DN24258_c0_g1~~TRINITY_DN24258_c0_g1_i1.p1  ORF type:complete len:190 (-),score=39.20 TRINITY_DN24258_c0_g1_i1:197-766(-)